MTVAESNNEKEFFVKEIPEQFTDWDLFRVFLKYGAVDNVRIPSTQNAGQTKYGFVTMLTLNGSDAVRKNINKRKLVVSDNISIWVSDIRVNGTDKTNPKKSDSRVLAPISQNVTPVLKSKQTEEEKGRRLPDSFIAFRDLSVGETIQAKVVTSPPGAENEFSFHVVEVGAPNKNYSAMSDNLSHYCKTSPSLKNSSEVKVGGFLVYSYENAYSRAKRVSETQVYLIDLGVLLPFSLKRCWKILPNFCNLPALVVPCSLANVKWVRTTPEAITAVRDVLLQWSETQGTVRIQSTGFRKSLNILNVIQNEDSQNNLINSLTKEGYCELSSEDSCVKTYSRAELLNIKTKIEDTKCCGDMASIQEQFQKFEISEVLIA
ncbi:unnamed protein product [Auanema sp. JU1783]|nr:unnamed protein product [Auanema sp. JU1783]